MKKQVIALLSVTIIAVSGVNAQTKTKAPAAAAKSTTAKTEVIDLTNIEIPAKMTVPVGVKGVVGKYDNSIAGPNDFEISIETAEMTIAEQMKKTEKDEMTKFIKYVAKDANGFMYMAEIMGKTMCHFEYIVTVEGKSYRMYDKRSTPLSVDKVKAMYEAVKTIK